MNRTGRFLIKQLVERNTEYVKTMSSGRDLVIYCDYTQFIWHPRTGGFAGSEEAVIYLARELMKLNWDVTVYNNCGHKPLVDEGVTYRPFWEFNPKDKQDVVIVWKSPNPLDLNINAERIFVDMHDAIPETRFTDEDRIGKITRVFFKSDFHRSLYPSLPEDKTIVIPNGIDFTVLQSNEPKDLYLLINTSSGDRSMGVLPKLFREVKQRVPQARLQWSYGWGMFDLFTARHPEVVQWKKQTQKEMDDAGIETLGHLSSDEVGKLYQRGAILAYPTDFPENDCMSVKKAQACGCVPVTTDAGALATSVKFGVKIPYRGPNALRQSHRFWNGIEDAETQRLWVDATVDLLTNPAKRSDLAAQGAKWARQFEWALIAQRWHEILRG